MDKVTGKLMVLFEDPFWIGIFERIEDGKLSVCKVTFGKEPKDYELWHFLLENYYHLKFSPSVDVTEKKEAVNSKRLQREARKQTIQTGIGTKSQQALQLQREASKSQRSAVRKKKREDDKQRLFDLKQQKRKEKHRGR